MHRHEVEPGDVELRTTMRHAEGLALTPRLPGREGRVLRRLVPRRLRHAARGARRPARRRRGAGGVLRLDRGPGPPAPVGRRGPPPPAHRGPGRSRRWPPRSAPARWTAAGRSTWSPRRSARWRCCRRVRASTTVLGALGKKERHEIRRKVRRAEAAGEVRLDDSSDPLADLPAFIDLHQKRWGARRPVPGDARRRAEPRVLPAHVRAVRRRAARSTSRSSRWAAGGSRPASRSRRRTRCSYYNAGVDPEARELSPGVRDGGALRPSRAGARPARGWTSCAGDEGYKYEWGAVDETIQRLLVRRTAQR